MGTIKAPDAEMPEAGKRTGRNSQQRRRHVEIIVVVLLNSERCLLTVPGFSFYHRTLDRRAGGMSGIPGTYADRNFLPTSVVTTLIIPHTLRAL